MPHHMLMYILALIAGALVSTFLGIYAWKKIKDAPGVKFFCMAAFLAAFFSVAYAFELTSVSLEMIMFWVAVEYAVIPFLPVAVLLMCVDYAGRKLPKWVYVILLGIPLTTIILQWTNSFHHLYYTSVGLRGGTAHPVAELEGGPWFWVHSFFLYICFLASVGILIWKLQKGSFRFQIQLSLMIIGLLIPPAASIFYLNGWSGGIDLGPVSICISFLLQGAALLWFQMFDVVPIARETVFENLEEGVMVLNKNNMVVDYNRMMKTILPSLTVHTIGQPVKEITGPNEGLAAIILSAQACDYTLVQNGQTLHFHIRFAPLYNKKSEIAGKVITFSNVTERVRMEKQMQKLAQIDGLTGMLNRSFFLNEVEAVCRQLKEGGNITMIIFDVDHFKRVNDTFGHEAGDHVLTSLSRTVREKMRPQDLLARYGGEEFIVFLPHTSLLEARERAEAIRAAIEKTDVLVEGKPLRITSSFGLSHARIQAGAAASPVQMLIREADQALYTAKRNGRNCVKVFKRAL